MSLLQIGILIGADHYHNIVTGEVIKGSLGPATLSSKLSYYQRLLLQVK